MAFSCINDAGPRERQKLLHHARHSGASLIHEGINLDSAGEGRFFRRAHLRRAYDRRIQSALRLFFFLDPPLFFFLLLDEDFFFFFFETGTPFGHRRGAHEVAARTHARRRQ